MAIDILTAAPLAESEGADVHYRQAISPSNLSGSFVADDTDQHQIKVRGRGKGRLSVAVDNPANQTVTLTVYGMHDDTGAIGDVGTFLVGSFTVTAAGDKGYETVNDAFPFYLLQAQYGVTPTDDPLKTCTFYVNFSAF